MAAASDYLEPKILDHVLGKGARNLTSPPNLYVALFTGSSASAEVEAGTLTSEVSDANYARQSITFDTATSSGASNSNAITFAAAAADIGTIRHMAIMDGDTEGSNNVLFHGAITNPKEIFQDDSFQIPIGSITITLA
jgi:hypothetical protein